jgi:hypothetical protein
MTTTTSIEPTSHPCACIPPPSPTPPPPSPPPTTTTTTTTTKDDDYQSSPSSSRRPTIAPPHPTLTHPQRPRRKHAHTRTPSKSRTHAYARNHSSTTRITTHFNAHARRPKGVRASADSRPSIHPPRARTTRPTRVSCRHRKTHRAAQSPPLASRALRRRARSRQTDRRAEDQTTSMPWGADVMGMYG